jgi:hypothetical protein
MGQFPPFADLTRWGLVRALAESGITLAPVQQDAMAGAYRRLRPFDDARPAVATLRERGHSIVVFSVGSRAWLEELAASYRDFVDVSSAPRTQACTSLTPVSTGTCSPRRHGALGGAVGVVQPLRYRLSGGNRDAHRVV